MDAADAAGLVARAAVEMTGELTRKKAPKAGAIRMTEYRDRREAMGMPRIFPAEQFRPMLVTRDGERCIYCEAADQLVIDHIHPTFLGGNDDLGNLGLACRPCNGRKAGKPLHATGMQIVVQSAADAHKGYISRTVCAPSTDHDCAHEMRTPAHTSAQGGGHVCAPKQRTDAHTGTNVRPDANPPLTYLLSTKEKNLSEKKESKKERIPKKRDGPLPSDWAPTIRAHQIAEENSVNVQIVEQIFRDYLKSSGKLYADYDAAFYNFLRNQRRFNGNANHGTSQAKSGGSLTASIRRELAELEQSEGSDFALPAGRILRLSN
jgi:hypothetical protein